MSRRRIKLSLYSIPLLCIPLLSNALPEDAQQRLQFSASRAELSDHTHTGTLIGDVTLDQGSTHVRGTKALTQGNTSNQLVKAIIEGDLKHQAHYWTLTTKNKPILHAYADIIYYYPQQHRIELVGHAKVAQGNDAFTAAQIQYDLLHQQVFSKSDGQTRTNIIIHPGKNHGIDNPR